MIFDLHDRSAARRPGDWLGDRPGDWLGDRPGDEWPGDDWPGDDWPPGWWPDEWSTDSESGADWSEDWTARSNPDWSVDWTEESADDWTDEVAEQTDDHVRGFRLILADHYAGADDGEVAEALDRVLGAMSPAEGFSFSRALSQVARSAGQVVSNPAVAGILRTGLPIAGGALGTVIGGPVGTALGGQLGSLAATALPGARPVTAAPTAAQPAAVPAAAAPGVVVQAGTPGAAAGTPGAAAGTPGAAAGSASAAQGLVLAGNPLIQQALAAAALGAHGQTQVAGIPVARLLGLLSQVVGQAAAEADELLFGTGDGEAWDGEDGWSDADARELYETVLDATAPHLAGLGLAEPWDGAECRP